MARWKLNQCTVNPMDLQEESAWKDTVQVCLEEPTAPETWAIIAVDLEWEVAKEVLVWEVTKDGNFQEWEEATESARDMVLLLETADPWDQGELVEVTTRFIPLIGISTGNPNSYPEWTTEIQLGWINYATLKDYLRLLLELGCN